MMRLLRPLATASKLAALSPDTTSTPDPSSVRPRYRIVTFAERAVSGEMRLRLAYEQGMRAGDVVTREGFRGEEAQAILTMVNGEQRPHSQPLDDGDTVELVIPMVGGGALPERRVDSAGGRRDDADVPR